MNNSLIFSKIAGIFGLAALLVFLSSTKDFNHLGPDSFEYIQFADEIVNLDLFKKRDLEQVPVGSIIRTPGFPFILAIGKVIVPDNLRAALFVGHSLLFILIFISITQLFKSKFSSFALAIAIFPTVAQMREVFAALASEWSAFCFLILLIATCFKFYETKNQKYLLYMGLAASLTILARPALIVVAVIPFIAAFLLKSSSHLKKTMLAPLSLTLLWSWMAFNQYRLGSFAIAPRGGANIFCIGSIIGKVSIKAEDPPELQKYFTLLNKEIFSASPTELVVLKDLNPPKEFFENYVNNYYIADRIAKENGIDRVKENEYLGIYGIRSIRENFSSYLTHLYYGIRHFALAGYLLIPAFILPLYWLKSKKHSAISLTILTMLFTHFAHLSLVLITQPLSARYFSVTLYPLLFISILVVYQYMKDLFSKN